MVRYRNVLLCLVVVSLASWFGACKELGTTKRARIGVQVGSRAITSASPSYTVPFVETGQTTLIEVTVQSVGQADLEVDVPRLEAVDWLWAAGDDVRGNMWPVSTLELGARTYDKASLVDILERDDAADDASVALAQALIATRLIIASGGPESPIADPLRRADEWFDANSPAGGDGVPFDVDPASAAGADALDIADDLANYNDDVNPHLAFDPDSRYEGADFPLTIEPDGTREFEWRYAPVDEAGQDRDGRPVMVVLESNDAQGDEVVRVLLQFTELRVRISVVPSIVILVNPTSARPVSDTVAINNEGSGVLVIESISLERADDAEYDLIPPNKPESEWRVLPKTDPGYEPLTFQVRYGPRGDPAENAILIQSNDTSNRVLRIPIQIQTRERANCIFTYEDEAKGFLDFVGRATGTEKVINVYNEGPSNCVIKTLTIEPTEATAAYSVRLQRPATTPGGSPTPLQPPLSLARDKSAEVVVTFDGSPDDPANGTLAVDYENPTAGRFFVPILGGEETPVLAIGPDSRQLHLVAAQGESDSGTFVIANNGNGDLHVYSVSAYDPFAMGADVCDGLPTASSHLSVEGGPIEDATVPSFGLYPVTVSFSPQNDEPQRTGYIQIAYEDPNAATDEDRCQIALVTVFGTTDTATERPTADFAWEPATPAAGDSVLLDGSSSAAPAGGELFSSGYSWYLSAKPTGSKLILSDTVGADVQMSPDMAGTYRIHLVVFTMDGTYSAETAKDMVVQ